MDKLFLFCILSLSCISTLRAEWNPARNLPQKDISALLDQKFIQLKEDVSEALKTSWCSREKVHFLMDFIVVQKPKICVEIGAFTGSSVLPVAVALRTLNEGKVYAIDAWSNKTAISNMSLDDPNRIWWAQVDMLAVKDAFIHLLTFWNVTNRVEMVELCSEKAIHRIDEIDFLHIDGDCSEKGTLQDIELYLPKVNLGGYIFLSNLNASVNGKQLKINGFLSLLQKCQFITFIENDNSVLFKKI